MKLRKSLKKTFWTTSGLETLFKQGFFIWTHKSVEHILGTRSSYQLILERDNNVEFDLLVNKKGIMLYTLVVRYAPNYKKGQWNEYGTYDSDIDNPLNEQHVFSLTAKLF